MPFPSMFSNFLNLGGINVDLSCPVTAAAEFLSLHPNLVKLTRFTH